MLFVAHGHAELEGKAVAPAEFGAAEREVVHAAPAALAVDVEVQRQARLDAERGAGALPDGFDGRGAHAHRPGERVRAQRGRLDSALAAPGKHRVVARAGFVGLHRVDEQPRVRGQGLAVDADDEAPVRRRNGLARLGVASQLAAEGARVEPPVPGRARAHPRADDAGAGQGVGRDGSVGAVHDENRARRVAARPGEEDLTLAIFASQIVGDRAGLSGRTQAQG